MKSTQRQMAGTEKCSIQALPTQEPPSLQKVAYQERASVALLPDKVHGIGELGQLMSIWGYCETLSPTETSLVLGNFAYR